MRKRFLLGITATLLVTSLSACGAAGVPADTSQDNDHAKAALIGAKDIPNWLTFSPTGLRAEGDGAAETADPTAPFPELSQCQDWNDFVKGNSTAAARGETFSLGNATFRGDIMYFTSAAAAENAVNIVRSTSVAKCYTNSIIAFLKKDVSVAQDKIPKIGGIIDNANIPPLGDESAPWRFTIEYTNVANQYGVLYLDYVLERKGRAVAFFQMSDKKNPPAVVDRTTIMQTSVNRIFNEKK